MSPFATLPDLCLLALFKQLPPADQVTARKVCFRWADLVTYAAQDTRSLAIFVGKESMNYFKEEINRNSLGRVKIVKPLKKEDGSPLFPLERFNQWNALLYRKGLDEATVEAIGATFVNIKTLQIGLYRVYSSQFDYISRLLELWTHQVTTLKVYELFGPTKNRSADRFFNAINGLTTLKQLHLDLSTLPYHDLPIISQLEQLHVTWYPCSPRHFAAMLRQHATANTSLRSIEYIPDNPNTAIQHFTSLNDHLLSRFTRFGCPRFPHTNSELISTHFRHLTSLSICSPILSAPTTSLQFFAHLSQLTRLHYLHLYNFPYLFPDDQPHLLHIQLKSVKILRLQLTIHSHRRVENLNISWTMPNVEIIHFDFSPRSGCTDCTIVRFNECHFPVNHTIHRICLRRMFNSLKRTCTKLHAILHGSKAIFN